MAKLIAPFDPMQHNPAQGGGQQLPIGKHPVVITGDEVKANSAGNGGFVEFTLQIIDGPAKGASGPYRLNLYNQSAKAVEIANSQLAALCHVTGQFRLGANGDDTSVLHNIPFVIEVGLQKDPDAAAKGYTEVKRVYDMQGNEPGKQAQQQQAPSQPNGFENPAANQQFSQPAQAANPASNFNQQPQQNNAPAWGAPAQQQQPAQNTAPAQTGWAQNNNPAPTGGGMPWNKQQ